MHELNYNLGSFSLCDVFLFVLRFTKSFSRECLSINTCEVLRVIRCIGGSGTYDGWTAWLDNIETNNHGLSKFGRNFNSIEILPNFSIHLLKKICVHTNLCPLNGWSQEELRRNSLLIDSSFNLVFWVFIKNDYKGNFCIGIKVTIDGIDESFCSLLFDQIIRNLYVLRITSNIYSQTSAGSLHLIYTAICIVVVTTSINKGPRIVTQT